MSTQRKLPTPGEVLVAIRRYHDGPIGKGWWPTIAQLAAYCHQPQEVIHERVEILIDRRYVAMDGDQVMPWEARPGELIVRQMTEEERQRYGPPSRRPEYRAPATQDPDSETHETQQEVHDMPTGHRIEWPDDQEFLAEVEAAKREYGESWMMILARKYQCSGLTVRSRASRVKERLALRSERSAVTEPPSIPEPQAVAPAQESAEEGQEEPLLPPLPIVDDRTTEQRAADGDAMPGETMMEPQIELNWAQEAERAASQIAAEQRAMPATTLATHATLILIDEATDQPARVRVAHVHLTDAPEQQGDQWAEPIRINGRRTYRIWTCVGRVEIVGAPVRVMLPADAAIVRQAGQERGVA